MKPLWSSRLPFVRKVMVVTHEVEAGRIVLRNGQDEARQILTDKFPSGPSHRRQRVPRLFGQSPDLIETGSGTYMQPTLAKGGPAGAQPPIPA